MITIEYYNVGEMSDKHLKLNKEELSNIVKLIDRVDGKVNIEKVICKDSEKEIESLNNRIKRIAVDNEELREDISNLQSDLIEALYSDDF